MRAQGDVMPFGGKSVTETAIVEANGLRVTIRRTIAKEEQSGFRVILSGTVEELLRDGWSEKTSITDRELRLILSCTEKLSVRVPSALGREEILAVGPPEY